MMLKASFFEKDALRLAKDLLGKILRVKHKRHWLSAIITETEAYYIHEKASHSSLGYTEKRKALFMPAGTIYMYYSRGGDSLNISAKGVGNAVLIKAALPYEDAKTTKSMLEIMQTLNPRKNSTEPRLIKKLCAGQALLCRSLNLKVKKWDQQQFDIKHFYIDDVGIQPRKILQKKRRGIPSGRDEHLLYRLVASDFTSTNQ